MRYISVSLLILCLTCTDTSAQEKKFTIRTGAGYYADAMSMYNGPIMWLEGGYRFNTGFFLNGRVSLSTVDWIMSGGFYEGYRTILVRQMADMTFSRPIRLKGRHFLEPGLGFKLKRENNFYPDLEIESNSEEMIFYTRYSSIFYEIGFTGLLDYYYEFENNFYLGIRADANIIWAVGLEGLTLTPLFGFRF